MRGEVIKYDNQTGRGIISSDDNNRYEFVGSSVEEDFHRIGRGAKVDFEASDGSAVSIFPLGMSVARYEQLNDKNKLVASLLALLLGGLGIHKFYLGYKRSGFVMLALFFAGAVTLGLTTFVALAVAFIEALIYLCKSEEQFQTQYVQHKRQWF